jgi:hypothetical protein
MSETSRKTMSNDTQGAFGREPAFVSVNADTMRELHDTYCLYQQALIEAEDSARVLTMTGDVLASVHRLITDPGQRLRI